MKKCILFLLLLTANLMAKTETQLTLYFIPSPSGMDWSTPANIATSALKNRLTFKSHFMGHVFVELQCGEQKELTGMVGENFNYLTQLLIHNRGLGVLFHSFDGRLENKADVEEELKELTEEGKRINFVRYLINNDQCKRALTYLKEYREKNVGRYYGLANRPLYAEGAGCSAFGASFTEVIGVMDLDTQDAWTQSINIPLKFAGPPLQEKGVNLLTLMFDGVSWAQEKDPHQKLTFWSPDRMYDWVKLKVSNAAIEKSYTVKQMGKSSGVVIDKSFLPAPAGPIWQQHLDEKLIRPKK